MQWVTGTQYITPADMDVLISGPDRPPSKRMLAQQAAEADQLRRAGRASTNKQATAAAGQSSEEGYWAYMQRQVQERTEKLGLVGDNMEQLEQNSSSWAEEANKFVSKQKRGLATGCKFCTCRGWVEEREANGVCSDQGEVRVLAERVLCSRPSDGHAILNQPTDIDHLFASFRGVSH